MMNCKQVLPLVITAILVILFLVGCGGPTTSLETPTATSTPTPEPPTPTFTPTATTGQVKGILVDEERQEPLTGKQIFLPVAKEEADGKFSMSLAVGETLETKSDDSGVFLFEEVQPENYGLAVFLGMNMSSLTDDEGVFRIFEVEAGQVVDLGKISVK